MAKNTSRRYNMAKQKRRRKFFSKKRTKQLIRLFRLGMRFIEGLWALIRFIDRIRSLRG